MTTAATTARATTRSPVVRAFGFVGRQFTDHVLAALGRVTLLVGRTARSIAARRVRVRDVAYQVQAVGVRSLGLVVTMAAFAGMVLAFQFGYGLERFGAKLYIGQTTVTALVRELGPILTALVAGVRIGAGIAAELGGMAVTEQLDAVRALGADPIQRLVAPRVLAVAIALPLLTVVADAVGAVGGLVVGWLQYGVPPRLFASGVEDFVSLDDFGSGLVKAAVFGVIVGVIASATGLRASGGTEGVGRATTRAVVTSALMVLAADFLLTKLMLTL
jgi:phospholipid/cholesterol/gamma-HCH transport system permease protein